MPFSDRISLINSRLARYREESYFSYSIDSKISFTRDSLHLLKEVRRCLGNPPFFARLFPKLGPIPASIGSLLVNTSSDNNFSAAFRRAPPPPPPSSATTFFVSHLSLSLASSPTRAHRPRTYDRYVCYITLCTAACWSTYLWPMYTCVIPGTYTG